MRGKLSDRPFPDIARRLSNDDVTGALEVTGESGVARVFFRSGAVYWAMSPAPRARLGDRLVNAGFITQEQLDRALDEQRRSEDRTKLGALLVSKALVGRDVIRVFVQEQILDALFDLVRWHDGDWVFHPGDAVDDKLPIDVPVSQMLVEVARRQSEWDQIQDSIPTLDAVPDHVVGGNATTAALEQDEFTMLASIDGNRSVRELASDLGYSEFEAGRIVYGLTLLGIVEILPEEDDEARDDAAPDGEARDDEVPDDEQGLPELAQDPTAVADVTEVVEAVRDEQARPLDTALADAVESVAGAETPTAPASAPDETAPASFDSGDDRSAREDDDIDVGAALEQALFGGEPEPEPADKGLEVTVHFALDEGVAERSAHASTRETADDTITPPSVTDAEPADRPAPASDRPQDEDEPEPWVFRTDAADDVPSLAPTGADDDHPAAADLRTDDDLGADDDLDAEDLRAANENVWADDELVTADEDLGAADDDLDALDDFFDAPATGAEPSVEPAPPADEDDGDTGPAYEPTTTDLSDDLDDLVAELAGDEPEDLPDEPSGPPPPPGSSVPGAAPPGGDPEPDGGGPARQPGGRGDVSEFLRELTQLNLDDEGDEPDDGEDDPAADAASAAASAPPARRREPPEDKKDDKKKKGLFGWGR